MPRSQPRSMTFSAVPRFSPAVPSTRPPSFTPHDRPTTAAGSMRAYRSDPGESSRRLGLGGTSRRSEKDRRKADPSDVSPLPQLPQAAPRAAATVSAQFAELPIGQAAHLASRLGLGAVQLVERFSSSASA